MKRRDCGSGHPGQHLKQAIEYITVPEKTCGGKYVAGLNCQPEYAYKQMVATKRKFGKTDKRQGYHLIISFKENEVTPEKAFEIIGKFAKEYLGSGYEAVYAVHDNTHHVHGHIIFNSVNYLNGKKFRYEKGDWAKYIQPITNRLCEEYGLSIIEIENDKAVPSEKYQEWDDYKHGKFVWSEMIKRDLDVCVMQASTFDSFLDMLKEKGYEIKQNKYLAIKPKGMTKFKRCYSLGENYSEERLKERILKENLSAYKPVPKIMQPRIVTCRVRCFKRAKLTGLQKRYFAKLYRIGKLKKRPYSQAWKYREYIRKMKKIQEQYLFLVRHDIYQAAELAVTEQNLTDKKKEVSKEKSKVFKERAKSKSLFAILEEMEELRECEDSFQNGDKFFEEEHNQWKCLEKKLMSEGYTVLEVMNLKEHYRSQIAEIRHKEKAVAKEVSIAKSIISGLRQSESDRRKQEEMEVSKKENKSKEGQPRR